MAKSQRGFASMDATRRLEIARKGGRAVPAEKRAFSKNPELASAAGRLGGSSLAPAARSFSKSHELAVAAGRKGGLARREASNGAA